MPGCSAYNCSNSAAKGFLMKSFPRDPNRRKVWTDKVMRANWLPTNYSALCEVHFEDGMWEKDRVDGKRKLKHNAVPTLFNFPPALAHCKAVEEHTVILVVERTATEVVCEPELSELIQDPLSFTSTDPSRSIGDSHRTEPSSDVIGKKDWRRLQEKLESYNRKYISLLKSNKVYKNKLRNHKIKVKKQEEEIKLLRSILGADQINALTKKGISGMTKKNTLKSKFTPGQSGNEEIKQ